MFRLSLKTRQGRLEDQKYSVQDNFWASSLPSVKDKKWQLNVKRLHFHLFKNALQAFFAAEVLTTS